MYSNLSIPTSNQNLNRDRLSMITNVETLDISEVLSLAEHVSTSYFPRYKEQEFDTAMEIMQNTVQYLSFCKSKLDMDKLQITRKCNDIKQEITKIDHEIRKLNSRSETLDREVVFNDELEAQLLGALIAVDSVSAEKYLRFIPEFPQTQNHFKSKYYNSKVLKRKTSPRINQNYDIAASSGKENFSDSKTVDSNKCSLVNQESKSQSSNSHKYSNHYYVSRDDDSDTAVDPQAFDGDESLQRRNQSIPGNHNSAVKRIATLPSATQAAVSAVAWIGETEYANTKDLSDNDATCFVDSNSLGDDDNQNESDVRPEDVSMAQNPHQSILSTKSTESVHDTTVKSGPDLSQRFDSKN